MVKNLFIKLVLVSGIVLLCVFSIRENRGYTTFFRMRNYFNRWEINKEKSALEGKLKDTYAEIGRKVSNEDINMEKVKNEIDDLVGLSREYTLKIGEKKNQIVVCGKEMRERIFFEDLLQKLFSSETSKRLQALRVISKTNIRESLPYIGVLLVDLNPAVRLEAAEIINRVISSSPEEVKKYIPNLKYLPAVEPVRRNPPVRAEKVSSVAGVKVSPNKMDEINETSIPTNRP